MSLNPQIRDWTDKNVWVVGASSGIGRAAAEALRRKGARVIISARSRELLDAIAAVNEGVTPLPLDVSQPATIERAAQVILAQRPLDMVFYCAGHYREMRADTFDIEEILRHQQVNYVGALHVIDQVLPLMMERGSGHISLTGSVAGYVGLPKSLAYGPTKAALINLAESLYSDLHETGVGVSIVNPGFVETPLTAQNKFRMPGIISPEKAAEEILAGWAAGEFEIHFPKRFTRWMKALQLMPYRTAFPAVRKITGL